ncbi:hypothetical protein I4U23_010103 [Adineta vaga]|nr:hypothetical protein I4U23_010103 [Adineta vaga]
MTSTCKIVEFRRLFANARSALVLPVPEYQLNQMILATQTAFSRSPSLVWEFYYYRREIAHFALAEAEKRFHVITQNVDGLHRRAETKNLIEMHGNLFMVRCTSCSLIEENNSSPIYVDNKDDIDEKDLPCRRKCQSLLRPHIVWFGEQIWDDIGTSSVVYPAAGYASILSERNIPVVEINIETTPSASIANYHFHGPAAQILPQLLLTNQK